MPDTATEITFGDGTYQAWLPLPQATELERKCGLPDRDGKVHPKSLFLIYDEIGAAFGKDADDNLVYIGGGSGIARDANEVIRLGLIGGNNGPDGEVGPIRAGQIVELYGYPARPLSEVSATAWKILHAAIVGISIKKKAEPGESVKSPRRSKKAS
jgi:hypothetical protein